MNTYHTLSVQEIEKKFNTDSKKGLTNDEASKRLKKYGMNIIAEKKKKNIFTQFISQFNDFMIIILLAASAISFITGVLDGDSDLAEPIIILVIVILNAILGLVQENRAAKSLEALKKMSSSHTTVIRNGKEFEINTQDVVPGDIILLSSGDIVCADCRLISDINLQVDEASLTGESIPVAKDSTCILDTHTHLGDKSNMVFSSTSVIEGRGVGIVVSTGMNTEVGHIAGLIMTAQNPQTPLQKKLAQAGKYLGLGALIICGVIFLMGVARQIPAFEMFVTAVSLAVAAIPEGLPAIVTIMLAIGVQKMAKEGAIIRNLPSVEALGGAGVICSDKTGTLTQNKMEIKKTYTDDSLLLYKLAVLCSRPHSKNPTETAILTAGKKIGADKEILDKKYQLINELPFNSTRKRMTTIHYYGTNNRIITKGAVDIILTQCTNYWNGQKAVPMTAYKKRDILKANEEMANQALRVICVAYKDVERSDKNISEKSMTFVGLLAMADPPRKEAIDAVLECKKAGIRAVMVTGDHPSTACAIAKEINILSDNTGVMTGAELERMSQEDLENKISDYSVFARVTPEHKVRIVKAWQKQGHVVAMTGDGVNDAPALKQADIGCSLGIVGTEVAKSSSDMILSDDNFATIVYAVRQGRGIYDNIKKAVRFLLSSNTGEILTIFSALLFGWESPLLAIQLLWVNLVTDSLPAIALSVDPFDSDIMKRKPDRGGLFSKSVIAEIILEGCMIGTLSLLAFVIGNNVFGNLSIARTMAFAVLSISQLVHAFNMRSEKSIFKIGVLKNKQLVGAFIIGVILQASVISIPFLSNLFKVSPLSPVQWIITMSLSLVPLLVIEISKLGAEH